MDALIRMQLVTSPHFSRILLFFFLPSFSCLLFFFYSPSCIFNFYALICTTFALISAGSSLMLRKAQKAQGDDLQSLPRPLTGTVKGKIMQLSPWQNRKHVQI